MFYAAVESKTGVVGLDTDAALAPVGALCRGLLAAGEGERVPVGAAAAMRRLASRGRALG